MRLFSVLLSTSSPLAYFLSFPSPLVGEGGGEGALKVRMRSVMRGVMKQVDVSLKKQFALTTRNILLTYHISNVPNDREWKRLNLRKET